MPKHLPKLVLLFFILISAAVLMKPKSYPTPTPHQALIPPPTHGVYLSAFPDFTNPEDKVTDQRIKDYIKLVGKGIVWAYFSNNWWNGVTFPKQSVEIIHQNGIIPFIRMMPRSSEDQNIAEPLYNLQNINSGKFDKELTQWALDAKSVGYPLMVEFGTEVNGEWFSWNGKWNGGKVEGPKNFIQAYRHIINLFRAQGVTNIAWVYHANSTSFPDEPWNSVASYYPGDDYIDWIGTSVYSAQREGEDWLSFSEVFDKGYSELTALSKTKPLAVLEFGIYEDPKAGDKGQWVRDAMATIKQNKYPRIKAISYWNDKWQNNDGTISNLRIDSSPGSLKAYQQAIQDPYFISKPELDLSK